ncbi:unnamed protein product [Linum tenue]|uniref:Fe2OG dioxygenase domain-containing protein n=1 Tax=Linum tenue TaxID=586396 RepID=A0AAV0NI30_9ROSI|nr:unnamed protein product [Linum tenue]
MEEMKAGIKRFYEQDLEEKMKFFSHDLTRKIAYSSNVCHYYPRCPQPDRTLGTGKHTDSDFMTILLQDHVGGLQVLHQDHWVDVTPLPGSLVINIGDLLQVRLHSFLCFHTDPSVAKVCGPKFCARPSISSVQKINIELFDVAGYL